MFADQALVRFAEYPWRECLDVGSGSGTHADELRRLGKSVITVDSGHKANIPHAYQAWEFGADNVEAIWCSHTLEHQVNPGAFLQKMQHELRPGGLLAITVPPAKHNIVGGHVTLWNAGLLLYQLILAGFDCSQARVGSYGYNISVIVELHEIQLPPLANDAGDIDRLAQYFPGPVTQGFNGQLPNIRW